jgi:hypothetical protein
MPTRSSRPSPKEGPKIILSQARNLPGKPLGASPKGCSLPIPTPYSGRALNRYATGLESKRPDVQNDLGIRNYRVSRTSESDGGMTASDQFTYKGRQVEIVPPDTARLIGDRLERRAHCLVWQRSPEDQWVRRTVPRCGGCAACWATSGNVRRSEKIVLRHTWAISIVSCNFAI